MENIDNYIKNQVEYYLEMTQDTELINSDVVLESLLNSNIMMLIDNVINFAVEQEVEKIRITQDNLKADSFIKKDEILNIAEEELENLYQEESNEDKVLRMKSEVINAIFKDELLKNEMLMYAKDSIEDLSRSVIEEMMDTKKNLPPVFGKESTEEYSGEDNIEKVKVLLLELLNSFEE